MSEKIYERDAWTCPITTEFFGEFPIQVGEEIGKEGTLFFHKEHDFSDVGIIQNIAATIWGENDRDRPILCPICRDGDRPVTVFMYHENMIRSSITIKEKVVEQKETKQTKVVLKNGKEQIFSGVKIIPIGEEMEGSTVKSVATLTLYETTVKREYHRSIPGAGKNGEALESMTPETTTLGPSAVPYQPKMDQVITYEEALAAWKGDKLPAVAKKTSLTARPEITAEVWSGTIYASLADKLLEVYRENKVFTLDQARKIRDEIRQEKGLEIGKETESQKPATVTMSERSVTVVADDEGGCCIGELGTYNVILGFFFLASIVMAYSQGFLQNLIGNFGGGSSDNMRSTTTMTVKEPDTPYAPGRFMPPTVSVYS